MAKISLPIDIVWDGRELQFWSMATKPRRMRKKRDPLRYWSTPPAAYLYDPEWPSEATRVGWYVEGAAGVLWAVGMDKSGTVLVAKREGEIECVASW